MLPWLIGAAVVAGIGYLASDKNDEDERRSNRAAENRRVEEERRNYEREQRRKIEAEIEEFKRISQQQMKKKYDIDISFNNQEIIIDDISHNGKIWDLMEFQLQLETENNEIENLINNIEREKNEI